MNTGYATPLNVLVAEDDIELIGIISMTLHNAGYSVTKAANGQEALDAAARQAFSLVVLDINMPVLNGLQACKKLRETSNAPVLMLSARNQERDLLDALEVGADAYMLKPFSPRAFVARTNALLRRSLINEAITYTSGNARLDIDGLTLSVHNVDTHLTKLEARLLKLLLQNAGTPVSRKVLIDEVWDTYSTANRNMLKQVIFRLRRKLAALPEAGDALLTVPEGYMWQDPNIPAQCATIHLATNSELAAQTGTSTQSSPV